MYKGVNINLTMPHTEGNTNENFIKPSKCYREKNRIRNPILQLNVIGVSIFILVCIFSNLLIKEKSNRNSY